MAESDTDTQHDDELDISDEDAARLLDEPDDPDDRESNDDRDDDSDGGKSKRFDTELDQLRREAQKWKSLARRHEKDSKERSKRLSEYENANKSESQRLQEALTAAERRAEQAESRVRRREIAEERAPAHATREQILKVAKRLTGDTDDDLEVDADDLFELLAPPPEEKKPPRTPARPKERLRGGSDPEEDDGETDPRKLAEMIRSNRGIH